MLALLCYFVIAAVDCELQCQWYWYSGNCISSFPQGKTITIETTIDDESKENKIEDDKIEHHKSYHRAINNGEARKRLKLAGKHCYLTRYKKSTKTYILSVYEPQQPKDLLMNFDIVTQHDGWMGIEGKALRKNITINTLLDYYEHNTIDPSLTSIGVAYSLEDWGRDQERERERKTMCTTCTILRIFSCCTWVNITVFKYKRLHDDYQLSYIGAMGLLHGCVIM